MICPHEDVKGSHKSQCCRTLANPSVGPFLFRPFFVYWLLWCIAFYLAVETVYEDKNFFFLKVVGGFAGDIFSDRADKTAEMTVPPLLFGFLDPSPRRSHRALIAPTRQRAEEGRSGRREEAPGHHSSHPETQRQIRKFGLNKDSRLHLILVIYSYISAQLQTSEEQSAFDLFLSPLLWTAFTWFSISICWINGQIQPSFNGMD